MVEDEPLIALELSQIIEDQGGVVAAVRTRQEALEKTMTSVFDAAILDVRLPDGTVFDVATHLQAGGVPFMFCTADGENPQLLSAWPGVTVVSKPHSSNIILSSLEKLLATRP